MTDQKQVSPRESLEQLLATVVNLIHDGKRPVLEVRVYGEFSESLYAAQETKQAVQALLADAKLGAAVRKAVRKVLCKTDDSVLRLATNLGNKIILQAIADALDAEAVPPAVEPTGDKSLPVEQPKPNGCYKVVP